MMLLSRRMDTTFAWVEGAEEVPAVSILQLHRTGFR